MTRGTPPERSGGSSDDPRADPPDPHLGPEDAEWLDELADRWVEVYKKSATTLVLLRIMHERGPLPAAQIAPLLEHRTGWEFTERGLYRTLRRLAEQGALQITRVAVARTGAKRQDFALTALGRAYLERIEDELI